jgi:hypothetical protein
MKETPTAPNSLAEMEATPQRATANPLALHWVLGIPVAALLWFLAYSHLARFADAVVALLGLMRWRKPWASR